MFYIDFENHEWTRIILSRIHDDLLWLGDSIISIDNDLIHKVTGLSNQGSNLVNTRNVHKLVEMNLNMHFDGRNMKVNSIQDDGIRMVRKILGHKFNHGLRIDLVPTGFLHAIYLTRRGKDVNL